MGNAESENWKIICICGRLGLQCECFQMALIRRLRAYPNCSISFVHFLSFSLLSCHCHQLCTLPRYCLKLPQRQVVVWTGGACPAQPEPGLHRLHLWMVSQTSIKYKCCQTWALAQIILSGLKISLNQTFGLQTKGRGQSLMRYFLEAWLSLRRTGSKEKPN